MRRLALLLVAVAGLATAAAADYARQWPVLVPPGSADAYAVELTPEVYAAVQRVDLRDLDVLDAEGRPVPTEVVPPRTEARLRRIALPWYRMPAPGEGGGDWRVIADVDADGRLRGLRTDAARTSRASTTLLVDAAALPQRPAGLEVAWRSAAGFDTAYRIEGSDDLDRWQPLGRGRLVDLGEGARRLQMRRLDIEPGRDRPRFLRLVPDEAGAPLPGVERVDAVWTAASPPRIAWRTLQPTGGAGGAFEYDTGGRYPVRWVDLDVAGNDARVWRLQSRDAADARWIDRAPDWVAYRVGSGRSPARVFDRPVRDRFWRLASGRGGATPALRLGHAPERAVFIASGRPPYVLVAGSAARQREARPVGLALADSGRPLAVATLGAGATRAGDAALRPARDWKAWGLWAVLGLGVLVVGGFALRLLREPAHPGD